MNHTSRTFFKSVLTLLFLACFLGGVTHSTAKNKSLPERDSAAPNLSGYKTWTKVNPKPELIPSPIAKLCNMPPPKLVEREKNNPHNEKYLTVYVNQTGKHAMLQEVKPHFPLGSVVVKEKLPTAESTTPELLTVMVKREAGFNPECGDWEFFVFDGKGSQVQGRGKIETCQTCHRLQKEEDFLYRWRYLPREVRQRLRPGAAAE
ncbi:MAG: cytochrome P460 family protein [Blastocatellia bacterium]|nr:cytochrome P460 family protein [Blastocatellia bacterium]